MSEEKCKANRLGSGTWRRPIQCSRKAWKDGFCKQHHPDMIEKRRDEKWKRIEAEAARERKERSLQRAGKKIAEAALRDDTDGIRAAVAEYRKIEGEP